MWKPRKVSLKARIVKATERPTGGIAKKATPRKDTENLLQRRTCGVVGVEAHVPVWAKRGLFKQSGSRRRLKKARLAGSIKT